MKLKIVSTIILGLTTLLLSSPQKISAQTSNDWPMAGANLERTGWTPETLPGQIKTTWVKPINPHISQRTQVIGAEGKVFVSTAKGLYAFDANSGNEIWIYPTELPLGHSPTYSNGVLYVGGMDRKMHAVNASTGQEVWTYTAEGGFSTNSVVVDGKVFAGSRDGNFYAIDASNGNLAWKYQTGNQILQSAAYKDGALYFASNDGYAYALNSSNGSLIWKSSEKLPSMGQYSWWPVVYQNYVIFTRTSFGDALTGNETAWSYPTPTNTETAGVIGSESGNWPAGQQTLNIATNPNGNTIPNYFETYPHRRNSMFLDRSTGMEHQFDIDNDGITDAAPISSTGDAGTVYPPIISGSDNTLYFRVINRGAGASFSSASISGWKFGTPFLSLPYSNTTGQSGYMPSDEPVGFSAGGNKVYWNLCCDRFVGAVDLSQPNTNFLSNLDDGNRQWRYINSAGLPFYSTPTNIGMPANYYQEAIKFFWDPPQPALFWNENDKIGPTIYQGKLYTILGNALVAFAPEGLGSTAPLLPSAPSATAAESTLSINKEYVATRLEQEVTEILAAGHLKPSYMFVGLLSSAIKKFDDSALDYWHNPADIQLILIKALPHLNENLQQQVKTYLQNEFTNYSPVTYSHIGWTSGNQRDAYVYPPSDGKALNINFAPVQFTAFTGWSQPPHNIYAIWKYAQAGLGNPTTLFSQVQNKLKPSIVQTKSNLTDNYLIGFPHVHNAYIAGYTGYIELAKMAGQTQAQYQPFETELNRLLTLRAQSLTTFPIPPSPYAADHNYFDTLITAWNFMYLTPELADYLNTNAQSAVTDVINTYQTVAPNWMIAHNAETQGESAIVPYQQTHSLFQAIAMVNDASSDELIKYLDTPVVQTGDLYYIDNLVAILDAPEGDPGTPPFRGDANGDNVVDDLDYDIWRNNYGSTTENGSSSGDFNSDTKVDGIDYVIWHKTYGN